jgi:RNA polymerase-binding transcription factor DksA
MGMSFAHSASIFSATISISHCGNDGKAESSRWVRSDKKFIRARALQVAYIVEYRLKGSCGRPHGRHRHRAALALKGAVDEHDPEGAATDLERSQIEALLDQARRHLSDFDRALRRLEESHYGTCESCGRPIAPERLAARPEASTCITCAAAE